MTDPNVLGNPDISNTLKEQKTKPIISKVAEGSKEDINSAVEIPKYEKELQIILARLFFTETEEMKNLRFRIIALLKEGKVVKDEFGRYQDLAQKQVDLVIDRDSKAKALLAYNLICAYIFDGIDEDEFEERMKDVDSCANGEVMGEILEICLAFISKEIDKLKFETCMEDVEEYSKKL